MTLVFSSRWVDVYADADNIVKQFTFCGEMYDVNAQDAAEFAVRIKRIAQDTSLANKRDTAQLAADIVVGAFQKNEVPASKLFKFLMFAFESGKEIGVQATQANIRQALGVKQNAAS